jgi:hypothetical protein
MLSPIGTSTDRRRRLIGTVGLADRDLARHLLYRVPAWLFMRHADEQDSRRDRRPLRGLPGTPGEACALTRSRRRRAISGGGGRRTSELCPTQNGGHSPPDDKKVSNQVACVPFDFPHIGNGTEVRTACHRESRCGRAAALTPISEKIPQVS